MGDPKKSRKKYSRPTHPWQKERIEEEKILIKEYGLKNKKEIWKATSLVRQLTGRAKKLSTPTTPQAEKEKTELLRKVESLNLVKADPDLDDVLGLNPRVVLDRRLQTVVLKKGLARSIKQARQMIVHEHITIGETKITVPSYLVSKTEEPHIGFTPNSSFFKTDHPERIPLEKKAPKKKEMSRERGRGRGGGRGRDRRRERGRR